MRTRLLRLCLFVSSCRTAFLIPSAGAVTLPLFFALFLSPAFAQQNASEYQVKAAYLYNFAKATQWPTPALPAGSNLVLCVFGGDEEFPKVLHDTLAGKNINGHAIEIRQSRSAGDLRSCQLAFLRGAERNFSATIALLERNDVLLVGESKEFLTQGGMISLILSDGKVTYETNSAALDRANVRYAASSSESNDAGGGVSAGETDSSRSIRSRVLPEYPQLAAKMKITGTVQVQAIVRTDGTVKEVHVMGGHPVLAEAVVQAVLKWHFDPGPKETTESLKINFGE